MKPIDFSFPIKLLLSSLSYLLAHYQQFITNADNGVQICEENVQIRDSSNRFHVRHAKSYFVKF